MLETGPGSEWLGMDEYDGMGLTWHGTRAELAMQSKDELGWAGWLLATGYWLLLLLLLAGWLALWTAGFPSSLFPSWGMVIYIDFLIYDD